MRWKSYRRLVRRLGLAIAVAAFAAPVAQAEPMTYPVGGTDAAPQVLYPDDLHATVPRAQGLELSFADDVRRQVSSEPRSNVPTDSLGRPLLRSDVPTDSLGRPLERPDLVNPTRDVVSNSTGFDWAYVGIGFVGLGMMLLVGGRADDRQAQPQEPTRRSLTLGESRSRAGPRGAGPLSTATDSREPGSPRRPRSSRPRSPGCTSRYAGPARASCARRAHDRPGSF